MRTSRALLALEEHHAVPLSQADDQHLQLALALALAYPVRNAPHHDAPAGARAAPLLLAPLPHHKNCHPSNLELAHMPGQRHAHPRARVTQLPA